MEVQAIYQNDIDISENNWIMKMLYNFIFYPSKININAFWSDY